MGSMTHCRLGKFCQGFPYISFPSSYSCTISSSIQPALPSRCGNTTLCDGTALPSHTSFLSSEIVTHSRRCKECTKSCIVSSPPPHLASLFSVFCIFKNFASFSRSHRGACAALLNRLRVVLRSSFCVLQSHSLICITMRLACVPHPSIRI